MGPLGDVLGPSWGVLECPGASWRRLGAVLALKKTSGAKKQLLLACEREARSKENLTRHHGGTSRDIVVLKKTFEESLGIILETPCTSGNTCVLLLLSFPRRRVVSGGFGRDIALLARPQQFATSYPLKIIYISMILVSSGSFWMAKKLPKPYAQNTPNIFKYSSSPPQKSIPKPPKIERKAV